MTWRQQSAIGQISLVLGEDLADYDAELLEASAVEAGCTKHALTFEFEEEAVIGAGPALPEALRARMRLIHYPDEFPEEHQAIARLRQGEVIAV